MIGQIPVLISVTYIVRRTLMALRTPSKVGQ